MHGVEPHIVIPSFEKTYTETYKEYALSVDFEVPLEMSPPEVTGEGDPYEKIQGGNLRKWQSLRSLDMKPLKEFSHNRVAKHKDLQKRFMTSPSPIEGERRGTLTQLLEIDKLKNKEKKAFVSNFVGEGTLISEMKPIWPILVWVRL